MRRGHTIGYVECTITDEEKPIDLESGFHVHGTSRPEGIRTVIPLSFSSTYSAASLPANGLPAARSTILCCPMSLITKTLRPNATELSLLSSDQVIGDSHEARASVWH